MSSVKRMEVIHAALPGRRSTFFRPPRRPPRRRQDAALVEPGRLPHRRPDGAERAAHQLDQRPRVRVARHVRQEARGHPGARDQLETGRRDDLGVQPAQGREVARRLGLHGGRRGVLDQAPAGPDFELPGLRPQRRRAAQDRRLHGRAEDAVSAAGDAADPRQQPLHDEQEVVRAAQRRQGAGLHQQGGELYGAQCDGHRALHARLARSGREERLQEESQLVGPHRQVLSLFRRQSGSTRAARTASSSCRWTRRATNCSIRT